MSSITTLHKRSKLLPGSDLEIFSLPNTQFTHEGEVFMEFYPASIAQTIEFRIPNNGESYIDPTSIFMHVRCKIVRSDGSNTIELPLKKEDWDKGVGPAIPDKIYPTENFLQSFRLLRCGNWWEAN